MSRLTDDNVILAREIIGRYPRARSATIPLLHLSRLFALRPLSKCYRGPHRVYVVVVGLAQHRVGRQPSHPTADVGAEAHYRTHRATIPMRRTAKLQISAQV